MGLQKYSTDEERRAANLESQRRYREKNREALKEKRRQARSSKDYQSYVDSLDPQRLEEYREKRRHYRERNKDAIRKKQREIYEKNAERYVWTNLKGRAARMGIPFNIEPEDLTPPEFCPVLGIRLERVRVDGRSRGKAIESSPSVDRIIPELGYVKGNIIIVSYKANRIKNNATINELVLVAEFYKRFADDSRERTDLPKS